MEGPLIDLSSQEIRRRVEQGEPYHYWVPDGVADIIERHGLYRGGLHADG
jgi:nicotinate-nucleotide adenylyltransferase